MSDSVDFFKETLVVLGPINTRKMFGGTGFYHDGIMFALEAYDQLYLKTDEQSRTEFIDNDLGPFVFEKDGKQTKMSYYQAPEVIFEEPEQAEYWAKLAFAAALRAKRS